MLAFYTKLLGYSSTIRRPIDKEIIEQGTVLSQEQQVTPCKPFTHAEIKEVIFSIPNFKSLGPDGFGSGFFKTTWPETCPLVYAVIQDFFTNGKMPQHISATKMILLPKFHTPIHHFTLETSLVVMSSTKLYLNCCAVDSKRSYYA